ncbi:MAG TPA: glycosyltransferase family 2 protein, partial [Chloroflexota bacterium]
MPDASSDDLAVVIVSYNTAPLLRACLEALQAALRRGRVADSTDPVATRALRSRVFVVDNASTDESAELVAREFPDVRLLALDENRGFAAANNLALKEANARYVWLLNPDTEVLGDAPAALVRFMDEHPEVGACGGRLLNPDLSFQHSAFSFPTLLMAFFDFFPLNHRVVNSRWNGRYPRKWYTRAFPIDHPLGADLLVRGKALARLGLLDEGFFMYCEEVDWCYRIKQAGWQIYYVPGAEVIHHVASSTRQVRGPMFAQLHQSRDRFFCKHYGGWFAWLAQQIVRFGLAVEAARLRRAAAAGRLSPSELARELAVLDKVQQ